MNYKKPFFILGAYDPEMREIERILRQHGHAFAVACEAGKPVSTRNANRATSFDGDHKVIPQGTDCIVFVECRVLGLAPTLVIDHHAPGDPGYGVPPQRYMEGSSLGQLLLHLGLQPTYRQRLIAAGDHCLAHAYMGHCPGVDPEDLFTLRVETRAEFQNTTKQAIIDAIYAAKRVLESPADTIPIGDVQLPFLTDLPPEVDEASARWGLDYVRMVKEGNGGHKVGLRSTRPEVVERFMRECGLVDVYGDPIRGFAGGYTACR